MKQYGAEFFGTFWLVSGVVVVRFWLRLFRGSVLGYFGRPCVWSNRIDDGLCDWSHFGLPPQSGCLDRIMGGRAFPGRQTAAVHHCATPWGHCRGRCPLPDRYRQGRFHGICRLRVKRLRGPFARWLLFARSTDYRDCDDDDVPYYHSWGNRQAGAPAIRTDCHWAGADVDSSDQHPGHQHVREPRPKYRRSLVCRRLGHFTTMAVLGCCRSLAPCWALLSIV